MQPVPFDPRCRKQRPRPVGKLRLSYEWNPNLAPTDVVPTFVAQPEGPAQAVMARFGVTMTGKDGKPRQPLLSARTDGIQRGQFRSDMKLRRCIIPPLAGMSFETKETRRNSLIISIVRTARV